MSDSLKNSSLSVIFYRFKESPYYSFTLFFFVFIIALFLLLFAVVPQVQSLFTLNDEIEKTKKNITILQSNTEFLSSLSASNLKEDLKITFTALPTDKDFVGIITALSNSAARAAVSLDNYNLVVGELKGADGESEAFFTLSTELVVHGNEESIKNFLETTQKAMPVVEIDSVNLTVPESGDSQAEIVMLFYFKVYKNESYSIATPIAPITPEGLQTIKALKEWKSEIPEEDLLPDESGSESAGLGNPF